MIILYRPRATFARSNVVCYTRCPMYDGRVVHSARKTNDRKRSFPPSGNVDDRFRSVSYRRAGQNRMAYNLCIQGVPGDDNRTD